MAAWMLYAIHNNGFKVTRCTANLLGAHAMKLIPMGRIHSTSYVSVSTDSYLLYSVSFGLDFSTTPPSVSEKSQGQSRGGGFVGVVGTGPCERTASS